MNMGKGSRVEIGDWVKLRGQSRKGNNRIHEHGELWKVVSRGKPMCFDGQAGILIESLRTGDARWIRPAGDRDFTHTKENH